MAFRTLAAAAALLASTAVAKTDIGGCTSFDDVYTPAHGYPYATRIWYVPDTGEVCELLDCGGGRAPPKTTVPGCAAYKGTETYSPRFINPATLGKSPLGPSTAVDVTVTTKTAVRASTTMTTTTKTATSSSGDDDEESSTTGHDHHHTTSAATLSESSSASGTASSASEPTNDMGSSASSAAAAVSSSSSTAAGTAASSSTMPGAAAAPTAAFMGSCLLAGAAACLAML